MSHSIAHRLRVAILPFAAIVVVACGGGAAAHRAPTGPTDPTDPNPSRRPAKGGRLVARAGRRRSYYMYDPTGSGVVRVDPDNGQVDELLDLEGSAFTMARAKMPVARHGQWGVLRVDPAAGSTVAEIAAPEPTRRST